MTSHSSEVKQTCVSDTTLLLRRCVRIWRSWATVGGEGHEGFGDAGRAALDADVHGPSRMVKHPRVRVWLSLPRPMNTLNIPNTLNTQIHQCNNTRHTGLLLCFEPVSGKYGCLNTHHERNGYVVREIMTKLHLVKPTHQVPANPIEPGTTQTQTDTPPVLFPRDLLQDHNLKRTASRLIHLIFPAAVSVHGVERSIASRGPMFISALSTPSPISGTSC